MQLSYYSANCSINAEVRAADSQSNERILLQLGLSQVYVDHFIFNGYTKIKLT